ncbi:MAG: GNAT family protein [Polyangiaceae bacterium]
MDATSPRAASLRVRVDTARLCLRPPRPSDVPNIRAALRRNVDHLRPFEPEGADTSKLAAVVAMVERERALWRRDAKYTLFAFARAGARDVVGKVALSGIHRASFQSAFLGYWVDADSCGRGYATEAVAGMLAFAFGPLGLHRVQAAIMPRNAPSLSVAAKVGFRHEGTAKNYLKIAGSWEDHHIFALTKEDYDAGLGKPASFEAPHIAV